MKQKQKICNHLVRGKYLQNTTDNSIIISRHLESDIEYKFALLETLAHHSKMFIKTKNINDFCELFEVMSTIAKTFDFDINQIEDIVKQKIIEQGDYTDRLYLETINKNNK